MLDFIQYIPTHIAAKLLKTAYNSNNIILCVKRQGYTHAAHSATDTYNTYVHLTATLENT